MGAAVKSLPKPSDNVAKDMARLLAASKRAIQDTSDFTLVSADGVDFPVHRAILAARFDFFRKLLAAQTAGRKNGRCTLDDVGGGTLDALVEFMYTGAMSELAEMAENLLVAADKYAVRPLKELLWRLLSRRHWFPSKEKIVFRGFERVLLLFSSFNVVSQQILYSERFCQSNNQGQVCLI